MKKIYVCSPYRGDVETNIKNVKKYCWLVSLDGIPIAPHLYFTQFLDDDYAGDRRKGILELPGGDIDAQSAVGLSGKLLQMASGAVYDENGTVRKIHEGKLEALEDLIEAANGNPVLIAVWYQNSKQVLQEKFDAVLIDTSEDIANWNAGKISVALIHPASAAFGLNIQEGGCHLIWYDLIWSLELYQQTNARLYRQGQKQTVTIQHIVTKNTIDEDVLRALESKDTTQEALLAAVKARIS